jgi:3-phosphoshikimate 1-carboxyvinyltransferase
MKRSLMQARFSIEQVSGEIVAPPSKSSMQRAVAAALLSKGKSVLHNPSFCDDSIAAMSMAASLGAKVLQLTDRVEIEGGLAPVCNTINCGESGLGIRMFSAIAATAGEPVTIDGHGSLKYRPMSMIEKPLIDLGVRVKTTNGTLPIEVEGPIRGGRVTVDGSQSSQFLTGLLFALPVATDDSIIEVINPSSKPYIDLTIKVLSHFGIEIENQDYSLFRIKGRQQYRATEYAVEGDWSGSAFFLAMAAISGNISIRNLDRNSTQADRVMLDVLKLAGAKVSTESNRVTVEKKILKPFIFDISDCPDLAPPMVILAAACEGTTHITGASRLVIKESSRGENLERNLRLLGAQVEFNGDRLEITGGARLTHALVHSSGDHRMAMAMASISTLTSGGVTVDDVGCINKSYPDFMKDFISSGGKIIT